MKNTKFTKFHLDDGVRFLSAISALLGQNLQDRHLRRLRTIAAATHHPQTHPSPQFSHLIDWERGTWHDPRWDTWRHKEMELYLATSFLQELRTRYLVVALLPKCHKVLLFHWSGIQGNYQRGLDFVPATQWFGAFSSCLLEAPEVCCTASPWRIISFTKSVFLGHIDEFFGRRNHGSFSNVNIGISLSSFKPIHKRNNTFLLFPDSM